MRNLIIFDMDGVLADACYLHFYAFSRAVYDVLNFEIDKDEHDEHFNGIPTKKKINKLRDLYNLTITEEEERNIYQEKQFHTHNMIPLFIGRDDRLEELLIELRAKGFTLACYSNSILKTIELILNEIGIYNYFDLIISNEDVKSPKPNPEGYIKAMERLEFSKDETYILEDSEVGLKAAILSGAQVLQVKKPSMLIEIVKTKILKEKIDGNNN